MRSPRWIKKYSLSEEIVSSTLHGIAFLLSVLGLIFLIRSAKNIWELLSFSIYGATLIFLFASSILYHSFQSLRLKRLFRIFDHVAIYLLIAGSYTPFALVSLRGPWGWSIFAFIWLFALIGIVHTALFIDEFRKLSVLAYIGMGFLILIAIKPFIEMVPLYGILWVVAGGMCYSLGSVFYVWERLPFNHALWHLFVMGGGACHFVSIYYYVR